MEPSWPKVIVRTPRDHALAHRLAEAVRRAVLGEERWNQPCRLRDVCRFGGFVVGRAQHLAEHSKSIHAALAPRRDGGFSVVVNERAFPAAWMVTAETRSTGQDQVAVNRLRFRVAHEIGHSFFYDRDRAPHQRGASATADEEAFCDEFASALLVPPDVVAGQVPTPEAIFDLSERYEASVEVVARAFARARPDRIIVGLLNARHVKSGRQALRVVWAHGTWLPRGERLGSAVASLAWNEGVADGVERLRKGDLRGEFGVVAARRDPRKLVVAVLESRTHVADGGGSADGLQHESSVPVGRASESPTA